MVLACSDNQSVAHQKRAGNLCLSYNVAMPIVEAEHKKEHEVSGSVVRRDMSHSARYVYVHGREWRRSTHVR